MMGNFKRCHGHCRKLILEIFCRCVKTLRPFRRSGLRRIKCAVIVQRTSVLARFVPQKTVHFRVGAALAEGPSASEAPLGAADVRGPRRRVERHSLIGAVPLLASGSDLGRTRVGVNVRRPLGQWWHRPPGLPRRGERAKSSRVRRTRRGREWRCGRCQGQSAAGNGASRRPKLALQMDALPTAVAATGWASGLGRRPGLARGCRIPGAGNCGRRPQERGAGRQYAFRVGITTT